MDTLSILTFKAMVEQAHADINERADEFSALDAVCGDADHGTAMVDAMSAVKEAALEGTEFNTMLTNMAMNAMTKSCGSTSTLIGGFFLGMGLKASGTDLTKAQIKAMFQGGLQGVQNNTKAAPGSKTIMDALVPAIEAIKASEGDVNQMMLAAATAAEQGALDTVNMQASFGRARNLGERSIGSADPGATSWSCMFQAFSNTINEKHS